jgi:predicted transcriptional regulator
MTKLEFNKKVKRDTAVTVRLTKETFKRLKEIAEIYEVSQADVIEQLIDKAHSSVANKKRKN